MGMFTPEVMSTVGPILDEAKKKKGKKEKDPPPREVQPSGWGYHEAYDYSMPLGMFNILARQGGANWGPFTAVAETPIDDRHAKSAGRPVWESRLLDQIFRTSPAESAWEPMVRRPDPLFESPFEEGVYRLLECGAMDEAELDEKHVGFKALKNKLAHRKGVRNPGALAASIGRKKYGAAGMARKAAAGR